MGDVGVGFVGTFWGVALVFWGACAVLVAVLALLRIPPSDEAGQIGKLRARIRRYRLAGSSRGPQP